MSDWDDMSEAVLTLLVKGANLRKLLEQETSEQRPRYVGLLGLAAGETGDLDPLGPIGLGLGSSRRARELVIKGLLWELQEEMKAAKATLRRGPGRPPVPESINVRRVRGLHFWVRKLEWRGTDQIELIRIVMGIERQLRDQDVHKKVRLLFGEAESTLAKSVSAGLAELGLTLSDLTNNSALDLSEVPARTA